MKEYILSIASAAVISAIMSIITPSKWSKYVGIVTGMTVVVCIGQPLLKLLNTDVFEGFQYEVSQSSKAGEDALFEQIQTELENRIEEDAELRLKTEFNADCDVEAQISINGDGKVEGVKSITIYGTRVDAVAFGRLHELYAPKEVRYGGAEKNSSKSE